MANYYYLGRKAFASILIWMSFALIVAVSGLVAYIASTGKVNQVIKVRESLEEEKGDYKRMIDGSNAELAFKAVKQYQIDKGKPGADKNLTDKFIEEGNYSMTQLRLILADIDGGMSMDKVKKKLEDWQVEGYNIKITHEDDMIQFYTKVIEGFQSDESYKHIIEKYESEVPNRVVALLKKEQESGFSAAEGARSYIKLLEGEVTNHEVQLKEHRSQETNEREESSKTVNNQHEVFASLSKDYFKRKQSLEDKVWSNMTEQREDSKRYLEEAEKAADEKRRLNLMILAAKQELEELRKIYADELGPIWVPPLDLVDGLVLSANSDSGFVIINIGRRHGLSKGQMFSVYQMKGKILGESKGRVKVAALMDYMSICQITYEPKFNPITARDVVANEKTDDPFDRKVPPKFVVRGEFSKAPSLNMIRAMIRNGGGEVQKELKKGVDYMVIGDKVLEDDLLLSQKLGVHVIRSRDLAEHFGYSKADLEKMRHSIVNF